MTILKMPDLYEPSKPKRRDFLRERGYKPSVLMTVLSRIPHWRALDGQIFTEVQAELIERKKERAR